MLFPSVIRAPLFEADTGQGDGGAGAGADDKKPGGVTLEQITALLDSRLNGLDKRYSKQFKTFEEKLANSPQGDPAIEPVPGIKEPDPATLRLQKKLTAMEADLAKERAERQVVEAKREETERHSAIRSLLAGVKFANKDAADDAFRFFRDSVKRGDDGAFVGTEDAPLEQFIKAETDRRVHWLAPKDIGGAGSKPPGKPGGSRVFTMDDLSPERFKKLTADEQASLTRHIADTARSALGSNA